MPLTFTGCSTLSRSLLMGLPMILEPVNPMFIV